MQDAILGERIRFCVGLVCGHLKSTKYAEMIAWQRGIGPSDLASIDFRVKYPGRRANEKGIEIVGAKDGEQVRELGVAPEFFGTDYNLGFFKYPACDYCDDIVAETADITVGDAWLPEYLEDGRGTNVVIVRHKEVQELIERSMSSGRIHLEQIDPDRVVESQEAGFRHRRDGLAYRLHLRDRARVWRPPKRVEAQRDHLTRKRRRIYKYRIKMALESDKAFRQAVEASDFAVFQENMEVLRSKYADLYKGPVWRRVLHRAQRKLKSMLKRVYRAWMT
jgi:coenzyme F420-reducing hydrogenase beta subunit